MDLLHIQNKIYEIRGHKIMLDFDLAELYEVQTKALNQAVKRNEHDGKTLRETIINFMRIPSDN